MKKRALALALLLFLPVAPAAAEDAPPAVAVPVGLPVQIDGKVNPTEWGMARSLPVGTRGAVLRLMQYRGMLLLAFTATDAWVAGDELLLSFAPDDAERDLGAWTAGAVSIRFEPLAHDRSHLIVNRMQGTNVQRDEASVVARARLSHHACAVELALPSAFLGLTAGTERTLRFHCMRARRGAGRDAETWPAGLDLGARAGAQPTDLRTSDRWGRLTGWTEAGGPGAISKTRWQALREAQDEITQRGREAHALMREMEEEQRTYRKQDTLVERLIFGNLEWIAEREPLADVDRLLLAKALRFLNRFEQASAVLTALSTTTAEVTVNRALYERALILHDLERFEQEAAVWERLAARTGQKLARQQYAGQAQRAHGFSERFASEQAARETDRGRADPQVEIVTNRGTFVLQLFPADTPKAVAHFLSLVQAGFYDGLRFHRVLAANLAQCGDPGTRDGDCSLAGSGESDQKVDVEENKRRKAWRGALAFARKRGLYANASQFFITTGPRPGLVDDSEVPYTVFGRVAAGMDVVDRLEWCDTLIRARVLLREGPGAKQDPPKPPGKDPKQEK